MKKILYINGNPQDEALSYSRSTAKYYLDQRKQTGDDLEIETINLYEENIQLIDEDILAAWDALGKASNFTDLSKVKQEKITRMGQVLDQFKSADEYVFATPLWNFSIPPMLKAYIDNIVIAGETFRYSENGPIGLLKEKKATIIQASGGVYSSGPASAFEHGSNYVKAILEFIGVTDVNKVLIEGVAMPGKNFEETMEEVYKEVDDLFEPEFV